MIILRIFINRIPDSWEPSTVWYLAAVETMIEAILISLLVLWMRLN
jgi:hypothetical protein